MKFKFTLISRSTLFSPIGGLIVRAIVSFVFDTGVCVESFKKKSKIIQKQIPQFNRTSVAVR